MTAALDGLVLADGGRAARVVEGVHVGSGQSLFGFARRLGLSQDESGEVVQEALLRLFRALVNGDDIAEPVAWAYRATYRLCMDRHRVRRRWQAFAGRLRPPDAPASPRTDELIAVWSEVDRLPPRQRAVLYLHYRADLPFEAIGAALGIDASTARSNASRGLARLRERLRDA